jgi:diguanylate cyclase (GGDEF)-like protein
LKPSSTHRALGILFGVFLGLHVPATWLLCRAAAAHREWWHVFLRAEVRHNGAFYLVLGIVSVVAFALVGALVGWRYDELEARTMAADISNVELSRQAATDGLTHLFNGAAIRERLTVEIENSFRSPLSCLLVDIDHFKRINDKHGHAAGDAVLIQVAALLRGSIRRLDAAGRLGGEEFLVLLPGTPLDQALATGDRIRKNVESEVFLPGDKDLRVTVSVGISNTQISGLSKSELLPAADAALYKAKRSGRNRSVVWESRFGFEVKGV